MQCLKWCYLLVLIMTALGCSKETSSGAGSDAPVLNTNVDFAQPIKEADLGLPKQLIQPQMTTAIQITLQVPNKAIKENENIINVTDPAQFNPSEHKSYQIAHEKLQVTLSDKQTKLPIVFYLIPRYISDSNAFYFQIFATLDNISYNVVSLNKAHTAFTGRFLFVGAEATKNSLAPFWNPERKKLDNSQLKPYQHWQSGTLLIRKSSVLHKPGQTSMPCFKAWAKCKEETNTHNKDNMHYKQIWFQPIAPMGYPSFNWSKHEFQTKLRQHVYGTSLSDDLKQLARTETTAVLQEAVDSDDIGWFGLPFEKREQVLRYHLVALAFKLKIDKEGQDLIIPENGIAIAEHQGESDRAYKPITMPQMSLDFKVNASAE
jgi:hypothetical protein